MPTDDDDLDEWADYSDAGAYDDEELVADIGAIMAGRSVVPAAAGWWKLLRERRAEKEAKPPR